MTQTIRWTEPVFNEEVGELINAAKACGLRPSFLGRLFHTGVLENLDNTTWCKLKNTRSWRTTRLDQAFEAATGCGRDAQKLLDAFREGKRMRAPVVLVRKDWAYTVSGNKRLMLCRATARTPMVFKLHIVI